MTDSLAAFMRTTACRRLLLAALWLACAASCVCVTLFPWWRDHLYNFSWSIGVATGWLAHGGWVKARARRKPGAGV